MSVPDPDLHARSADLYARPLAHQARKIARRPLHTRPAKLHARPLHARPVDCTAGPSNCYGTPPICMPGPSICTPGPACLARRFARLALLSWPVDLHAWPLLSWPVDLARLARRSALHEFLGLEHRRQCSPRVQAAVVRRHFLNGPCATRPRRWVPVLGQSKGAFSCASGEHA